MLQAQRHKTQLSLENNILQCWIETLAGNWSFDELAATFGVSYGTVNITFWDVTKTVYLNS